MNIKKCSLKTMCAALACTTLLSSMLASYATDVIITETPMDETSGTGDSGWTTEENSFEDIKVTYQQSSSYFVTIPKTIALDSNKQATYSVKVAGAIDTKQRVYVAPVDGIPETENLDFYMKEKDNKKADVVATITQNKIYWNSEEVANEYEETNNSVSAPDLTAGTWEGIFQMEIRLETDNSHTHNFVDGACTECGEADPNAEHQHNYVDGKCECGEVDPNHTHNYVDGTCTICGEEESYETAPAEAYSNWNYTLDDTNNIITLNYYTGSETDVIVYANYPINGKTYRTQLASNTDDATTYTPYMFMAYNKPYREIIKTITFSENIDTSNLTNTRYMFWGCLSLTSIEGISNWNTSNVTNMSGMFSGCIALTSIGDISNWNVSNVTDMATMFYGCKLTSLNLSSWNVGNVTNMYGMFENCYELTSLDFTSWNTSNVTDMGAMFFGCKLLTSLDLTSFDISKATTIRSMFAECYKLTSILVSRSKWITPSGCNTDYMFRSCGTSSVTYK